MTRDQLRQYNEDTLPDNLIGDDGDEEGDDPFASNNTDEVTHPQYQDIFIQKALAHRRIEFHQQDGDRITKIVKAARKAEGQTPPKRLVTLKGRYGAATSRTSLVVLDGVLYAGEYSKNDHKPVLPQSMVQQEIFRSHQDTGCGGRGVTCEHVRRKFHHSGVTSTRSLDSMADIFIPCFL